MPGLEASVAPGLETTLCDLEKRLPGVEAGPQRHEVVGLDVDADRDAVPADGRGRAVAVDLADLSGDGGGDDGGGVAVGVTGGHRGAVRSVGHGTEETVAVTGR